jgi:hypothetical protein
MTNRRKRLSPDSKGKDKYFCNLKGLIFHELLCHIQVNFDGLDNFQCDYFCEKEIVLMPLFKSKVRSSSFVGVQDPGQPEKQNPNLKGPRGSRNIPQQWNGSCRDI